MKNLNLSNVLQDDFKLVTTEFAGRVILGNDIANRFFGSYISSDRVENLYDSNIKLMVLSRSINRNKNDMLVNCLTEWFREEENTDINSTEYSKKLASIVSNMRTMAVVESLYGAKTSFGFAISNGNGDVIIYNVGSIRPYVKPVKENYVVNVTYLDPDADDLASLEDNNGSFYFYSHIDEVYLVPEEIDKYDIEEASSYNVSANDTVDILLDNNSAFSGT